MRDFILRRVLGGILDWITLPYQFERGRMPSRMQQFCQDKFDLGMRNILILTAFGGALFHLSSLIVEAMLPDLAAHLGTLQVYHVASVALLAVGGGSLRFFNLTTARLVFLPCLLICNMGNIEVAEAVLHGAGPAHAQTLIYLYQVVICIVLIVVFPFSTFLPNLAYTVYFVALNAWIVSGLSYFGTGMLVVSLTLLVTFGLKLLVFAQIVNVFADDYLALQKAAAAERALVERDLELARQIQDSIAPPSQFSWEGGLVRYRSHKHSTVGGDWAAIHVDAQGSVICVVADAMGKGLQAALVIHAVQSLWSEALDEEASFEPGRWLEKVNRSLFNMGKNATHMVTLGVVKLKHGQGSYWSAGHLPLFLVGEGKDPEVRSVLATGSPLGILASNRLQAITFATGRFCYLMLGTDGVFEKGTRHNRREIVDMMQRVEADQVPLAEISRASDDKTLITVDFGRRRDAPQDDPSSKADDVPVARGPLRKLA